MGPLSAWFYGPCSIASCTSVAHPRPHRDFLGIVEQLQLIIQSDDTPTRLDRHLLLVISQVTILVLGACEHALDERVASPQAPSPRRIIIASSNLLTFRPLVQPSPLRVLLIGCGPLGQRSTRDNQPHSTRQPALGVVGSA